MEACGGAHYWGRELTRLGHTVKLMAAQFVTPYRRSQIATGSQKHRDPRFPPYAFTEHGAIMASMILNSPHAVEMSVYVVRAPA